MNFKGLANYEELEVSIMKLRNDKQRSSISSVR